MAGKSRRHGSGVVAAAQKQAEGFQHILFKLEAARSDYESGFRRGFLCDGCRKRFEGTDRQAGHIEEWKAFLRRRLCEVFGTYGPSERVSAYGQVVVSEAHWIGHRDVSTDSVRLPVIYLQRFQLPVGCG